MSHPDTRVNNRRDRPGGLLLGIDLGTTAIKAAVFDSTTGSPVAAASVRLAVRSATDGTREQDLRGVERALRSAVASLRAKTRARWARVAGVGLSAQGGSAIIANRSTGRALTAMQLWNDTRPIPLLAAIAAKKPASYWRRLSRMPGPGAGLARMAWLRKRNARLFDPANIYVGAGEYLFFQLTGVWRQDAGSALQIGCYDVRRRGVVPGPLALVNVPIDFVAPMRRGHERHPLSPCGARLLGLPPGLPVAGPYMDHEAGYLGAAGGDAHTLQCSLGTAWVGNFIWPGEKDPPAGAPNLVLPSPLPPETNNLIVRVMMAGTVTWDWALATFAGGPRPLVAAERLFRNELLPPAGLTALPWLTRPNLLNQTGSGAGAFVGINAHTTAADLLRAIALGMCCEFAHVFAAVRAGRLVRRVVLTGGAAAGAYFRQLLAALLAPLPVFYADDEFSGVRGTLFAFGSASVQSACHPVPLPPREVRTRIAAAYRAHVRLCETLAGGFAASAVPDVLRHYLPRNQP